VYPALLTPSPPRALASVSIRLDAQGLIGLELNEQVCWCTLNVPGERSNVLLSDAEVGVGRYREVYGYKLYLFQFEDSKRKFSERRAQLAERQRSAEEESAKRALEATSPVPAPVVSEDKDCLEEEWPPLPPVTEMRLYMHLAGLTSQSNQLDSGARRYGH